MRERNHARLLTRISTWVEKLARAKATQKRAEKMLIELQRKDRRYSAAQYRIQPTAPREQAAVERYRV
jgi:hypothetical protein